MESSGQTESINLKFVKYLMSSYLYYMEDKSVLTDTEYDALCKELFDRWGEITHRHKNLTTKEDLAAGTGYALRYPTIVEVCARLWFKEHMEKTIESIKTRIRTR